MGKILTLFALVIFTLILILPLPYFVFLLFALRWYFKKGGKDKLRDYFSRSYFANHKFIGKIIVVGGYLFLFWVIPFLPYVTFSLLSLLKHSLPAAVPLFSGEGAFWFGVLYGIFAGSTLLLYVFLLPLQIVLSSIAGRVPIHILKENFSNSFFKSIIYVLAIIPILFLLLILTVVFAKLIGLSHLNFGFVDITWPPLK